MLIIGMQAAGMSLGNGLNRSCRYTVHQRSVPRNATPKDRLPTMNDEPPAIIDLILGLIDSRTVKLPIAEVPTFNG